MADLSNARSVNYVQQLKGSFIFKAFSILATFLAVPIMIKYLGHEMFGVWSTMLTLVTWVMLFDLGIGNGLKNKMTESLASGDSKSAREYISTAYIIIGLISAALFFIVFTVSYLVSWQSIFNTTTLAEDLLRSSVLCLSFFIFFNFWIGLVAQIYHGLQKSSVVVFGQFFSNAVALAFIYFLYLYSEPSVLYMVVAHGSALVISNLALSLFLFVKHRNLIPLLIKPKVRKIKPLMGLGIQFFIIQLVVLVIFLSDKILITQIFGPELVTPYEVVYKLFSVFTVMHSIILVPLWPAYSDAYHKNEFNWIRQTLLKQIKNFSILTLLVIGMAGVGPLIVKLWIGEDFGLNYSLYLFMAMFVIVSMWSNVFAYFVNAIGALHVQLITAIIAAIINIPLSIYFAKALEMGLAGIVLGTITSLSLFAVFGALQVHKLIEKKYKITWRTKSQY